MYRLPVFLYTFLLVPCVMFASLKDNMYIGGGLGWARLSSDRTLGWDRDVFQDIWFAEGAPQKASGVDDTLFAGWMLQCKAWVGGVEAEFGYGFTTISFERSNPYKKTDVFASKLSVGPRGGLYLMGGYAVSGWTGLLRLGYTCARMTHAYEDREGAFVEDFRTVRRLSSGIALGGIIQKEVTATLSVRLDYMYAFYRDIAERFRNSWNNTTVIQEAASLRSQRLMASIVWWPWRHDRCFNTVS